MNKKIIKWLPLVMFFSAAVIFVMAFFPGLINGDSTITGFKLVFGGFGGDLTVLGVDISKEPGFLLSNAVAYFGPLIVAFVVVGFSVLEKNRGLIKLVLSIAFAAVSVLSFISLLGLPENSYLEIVIIGKRTLGSFDYKLAWGAWVALGASVAAAASSVLYALLQLGSKK